MLQIRFLVITFLLTRVLSAETTSLPEKDAITEESYSSDSFYGNIKLPPDQDMYFPEQNGDKMYRTEKGARWEGKRGNFDISMSIDDKDPYFEFKTKWGANRSEDDSKKKTKD